MTSAAGSQPQFGSSLPPATDYPYTKRQIKAQEYRAARGRNIYGYLGCVFSLIALIVDVFGIPSLLAIIFGSIGIATAHRLGGGKGTGVGWSICGVVLGAVSLAFFLWHFYVRMHGIGQL